MKKFVAWVLCIMLLLGTAAVAEGEWRNILLLGNDTRNFPTFERSDVIIIVSVNESKGQVKLTSIMRDTDVKFADGGSGKINSAMLRGGPENALATVNKNFGTDISEYVVIDFKQLTNAVDLIGGVNVDIDEGEKDYINTYYDDFGGSAPYMPIEAAGNVELSGWQALSFCRNRYSTAAGDYDRVKRQRKMLIALLKELQEKPLDETLALADGLMDLVSTNMSDEQLMELGKLALTVDPGTIFEFRLPADGAFESGTFNGTWKIKPNLEKNKKLLNEFINNDNELKVGSQGEAVRMLQQKLIDLGLLTGNADGIYGNMTASAVSAAQAQMGMDQTGRASLDFLEAFYAL